MHQTSQEDSENTSNTLQIYVINKLFPNKHLAFTSQKFLVNFRSGVESYMFIPVIRSTNVTN